MGQDVPTNDEIPAFLRAIPDVPAGLNTRSTSTLQTVTVAPLTDAELVALITDAVGTLLTMMSTRKLAKRLEKIADAENCTTCLPVQCATQRSDS